MREFERSTVLLQNTFIVVRVDGRGFTGFCDLHGFEKPNDMRGIKLMTKCAKEVMKSFNEIIITYGDSDEFSFVFKRSAQIFNRREDKILSCVLSLFSTSYVFYWGKYFPEMKLQKIPSFDARIVLYPSLEDLQNYLSWRQCDCHINNLYNTTFWTLVQKGGLTPTLAHQRLKGTFSKEKNEILFSQFGINYNNEPEVYKRGTILIRVFGDPADLKEQKKQAKAFKQAKTRGGKPEEKVGE